jgi:DNA-binding transcriptional ArsR family regulator
LSAPYANPPTGTTDPDATSKTGTLLWLAAILECVDLDPTETLLLVALADHVNDQDECFVGIAKLARRARVSYGTTRRRLAALEDRGYITRTRRRREDGNLSVYDYVLQRAPVGLPARNMRANQRAPRRALTSAHPGARAEPPRVEPPRSEVTPSRALPGLSLDDAFDQFWAAYPRKTAKGAARKAWPTAVERAGGPEVIVAGAARYAADPNRDDAYTAHPATWLRADRWEDEPLPPRGGRPRAPEPTSDRDAPSGRLYL